MSLLRSFRDFMANTTAPLRTVRVQCAAAEEDESSAAAASAAASASAEEDGNSDPTTTRAPDSFTLYQVLGFPECPWFHRAACIASDLSVSRDRALADQVEVSILPNDRQTFSRQLGQLAQMFPDAPPHNTCPAIVSTQCHRRPSSGVTEAEAEYDCDDPTFVGGYSQLEQTLHTRYGFSSVKCSVLSQMTGLGTGGCPAPPSVKKQ